MQVTDTSTTVTFDGLKAPAWGIDWGTRKMEIVVVGAHGVLCRKRIPSESDKGYDHVLDQIAKLVRAARSVTGSSPSSIGIGVPGNLDRVNGRLRTSPASCLVNQPILEDLSRILRIPVAMENDARCFALAEACWGAGVDAKVVFGIIMGGGVGGGLVIDQTLHSGANGIAGEWGHNRINADQDGQICVSCGKTGCVETVLSGPAIERAYGRLSGAKRSLPEIVRLCDTDPHASLTLQNLYRFFGISLSSVIQLFDPDVIVLGGGVSNIETLYTEGKAEVVKNLSIPIDPCIRKNHLGDSAGVFGAARLGVSGDFPRLPDEDLV